MSEALAKAPPALIVIGPVHPQDAPAAVVPPIPVEATEATPHEHGPWAGEWQPAEEPAHAYGEGGGRAAALAEEDQGLDEVDFAAITGRAPAGAAAAGEAAPVLEPLKKRRRRREANPVVRVVGCVAAGLLALPVAIVLSYYIPWWMGRTPDDSFFKIGKYLPWVKQAFYQPASANGNGDKLQARAGETSQEKTQEKPEWPAGFELPKPNIGDETFKPQDPDAATPQEEPEPKAKPVNPFDIPEPMDPDKEPPSKTDPLVPFDSKIDPFAPLEIKPVVPEPKVSVEPKIDVDPDLTLPTKPEEKPETKPEAKVVPESKPVAEPAQTVGPRQAPTYDLAELGKALKSAHEAYGCPACNSKGTIAKQGKDVPCETCKGKPPTEITPETYEKFRRLAETVTFVQGPADSTRLEDQKQAVHDILLRIALTADGPDRVAALAKPLLDGDGAAGGGILLAGTVTAVRFKDGLHGAAIRLDPTSAPIGILSSQPIPVEKDNRVLILGAIVKDPAKNLAGYTGTQALVIWAGMAVKSPL